MKHFFCIAGVVLVGVISAGCNQGKLEAYVECRNAGTTLAAGFNCTIEHRVGSKPIHACWKAEVTCNNGTKGSGDDCGDVDPRGKSTVVMPYATFKGTLDKCDRVTAMNVGSLKATPK